MDMDVRPRTIGTLAVITAGIAAGLVAVTLNLTDNGPAGPAVFNNSTIPARVDIPDGLPHPPIQPGDTLNVPAGSTWIIPANQVCTWHTGKAGGPTLVSNTTVPVDRYITIEQCGGQ